MPSNELAARATCTACALNTATATLPLSIAHLLPAAMPRCSSLGQRPLSSTSVGGPATASKLERLCHVRQTPNMLCCTAVTWRPDGWAGCACGQAIQAQGHPPLFQEGGSRGLPPGMGVLAHLSCCLACTMPLYSPFRFRLVLPAETTVAWGQWIWGQEHWCFVCESGPRKVFSP